METHELGGEGPPVAYYDFSRELQPERVAYGESYGHVHQRFEREGRINHSFKNCPERKTSAVLKIIDEHGIWTTAIVPRVPSHD